MPEASISVRQARLADADAIARIHVASWRATYAGIIGAATLAGLSVDERAAGWRKRLASLEQGTAPHPYTCFVAVDSSNAVVGFANGGATRPMASGALPQPYDGELYAIYLEPGTTRRGTGARLVHAVASQLAAEGIRSLVIWALAANPCRGFYEALGGAPVFQQDVTIGAQTLPEVGFGWPDIHTLIMRTASRA